MPRDSRRRGPLFVALLAMAVAVAAAGLAALTVRTVSRSQASASASAEALAAGRQIAVDFAAYDYRHIAEDFKRVADESVGKFHQQYLTSSTGLRDLIVKAKAVSKAEVASAGVVDAGDSHATIVVALNRTLTNTDTPQPQDGALGVEITLVRQNGRWLASDVKPL